MVGEQDEPNVDFVDPALAFFNSQSGPVQAELIAIAAGLFQEPDVDGETKFWLPIGRTYSVRLYGRAYIGEKYWMHYEYESSQPHLTVNDCGPC